MPIWGTTWIAIAAELGPVPVLVSVFYRFALGAGGVALLFGREAAGGLDGGALRGLGLAALGTLFFSLGNMASRRNSAAGVPPVIANAWGMLYGALALLALVAATGTPLAAPPDARYAAALVYLAAVGSVVGFTANLSLVARIGSVRAAYATVLFPVVALALSTVYEGYRWHWTAVLGLAVALAGDVLAFSGPAAGVRAATPPPAGPAPPGRAPGRPPARAPR